MLGNGVRETRQQEVKDVNGRQGQRPSDSVRNGFNDIKDKPERDQGSQKGQDFSLKRVISLGALGALAAFKGAGASPIGGEGLVRPSEPPAITTTDYTNVRSVLEHYETSASTSPDSITVTPTARAEQHNKREATSDHTSPETSSVHGNDGPVVPPVPTETPTPTTSEAGTSTVAETVNRLGSAESEKTGPGTGVIVGAAVGSFAGVAVIGGLAYNSIGKRIISRIMELNGERGVHQETNANRNGHALADIGGRPPREIAREAQGRGGSSPINGG